jgi:hypothetical protein
MMNTVFAEAMVRQHQQDLRDKATQMRTVRPLRRARRHRLRAAAGWHLMRAGIWLAFADGSEVGDAGC